MPKIILAPMQGVLDPLMRELLTRVNDYDLCVSEFVRVVDQCLPEKVFYRLCPELRHQGYTQAGTPVRVQLLGQSPDYLAENAQQALKLGSHGIDLNCGCPSKTVNGNCGGASLLKDPELIYHATRALRQVAGTAVVSVKVRLGWASSSEVFEIADAVVQGGADEIAVHGRTKLDGYSAEKIDWVRIGELAQALPIPVIANGEIWNGQDAQHCAQVTQCAGLMVARGALGLPNLSRVVKYNAQPMHWAEVVALLLDYLALEDEQQRELYHIARIKQWLRFLMTQYNDAYTLFNRIKPIMERSALYRTVADYAKEYIDGTTI